MYVFQGSFTDVILGFLTYDPETEKEAMKWLDGNQKLKVNTGTKIHKLFWDLWGNTNMLYYFFLFMSKLWVIIFGREMDQKLFSGSLATWEVSLHPQLQTWYVTKPKLILLDAWQVSKLGDELLEQGITIFIEKLPDWKDGKLGSQKNPMLSQSKFWLLLYTTEGGGGSSLAETTNGHSEEVVDAPFTGISVWGVGAIDSARRWLLSGWGDYYSGSSSNSEGTRINQHRNF